MRLRLKTRNIGLLSKNRRVFMSYVKKFYGRKPDFPNSSFYFHNSAIDMIRKAHNYRNLLADKSFLESVYAVLSSWGMDRLDGSARLVEFDIFAKSVLDNAVSLKELADYKLNRLNGNDREIVKDRLSFLFDRLKIMKGKKLVGVSKALHHFLPDLVPPIDGTYTLTFFYENYYYTEDNQKEKFLSIFNESCNISKSLSLTKKDLKRKWDTSIPKLIDNAIIGFVSSRKA